MKTKKKEGPYMFIVCKSDQTYLKSIDSYGYTFTEDPEDAYPFREKKTAEKLASKLGEIYYSKDLDRDLSIFYYSEKQSEIVFLYLGNHGGGRYVITTECERYLRVGDYGSIAFIHNINYASRFEEAEAHYEFERLNMIINQRGNERNIALSEIVKVD